MQNYIQPGDVLEVTLGSGETAVASGKLYLAGVMVGVCQALTRNGATVFTNQASAAGDLAVVRFSGVVKVPKATGAIAMGVKLYYDATAGNITTTASGNTFAGHAAAPEISGATTVNLRLWQA